MVEVVPESLEIQQLAGLHLYHAHSSNCSARVRLLLEEKGLPWTSHHLLLHKMENISEDYFAVNPKGVVPALVHDGRVITESNDILVYLDETFPEIGFREVPVDQRGEIDRWLSLSTESHVIGIKTFQYHLAAKAGLKKPKDKIELYDKLQSDPQYKEFHAKFDANAITDEDAANAIKVMNEIYEEMELVLSSEDWLVANTYTLADISWIPTVTNLIASNYDYTPYPHLMDWHDRATQRLAYQKAVADWRARSFN